MSSRELLGMMAGMPFDSWFKGMVREDMDELIGESTIVMQDRVRAKTEALLRGEVKVETWAAENVQELDGRVRRI